MMFEAELLRTVALQSDVSCVAFSQSCLATCSSDRRVRLYSLGAANDFKELSYSPLLHHKYQAIHCAFSSNGERLATCSIDGTAAIIDVWTGNKLAEIKHPNGADLRVCRFSPTASALATGSTDGVLCIWELDGYRLVRSIAAHEELLASCAFTPDGCWLVTGSSSGDLAVWDGQYISDKKVFHILDGHDLGVTDCRFSPVYNRQNAKKGELCCYLLATTGSDDTVKLWELANHPSLASQMVLTCKLTLRGHSRPVYSCCFSPDGALLASGGCDYTVILWDPRTGQKVHTITEGHSKFVNSCCFSLDGKLLATASSDKTMKVWKIITRVSVSTDRAKKTVVEMADVSLASVASRASPEVQVPPQYLCPITRELMRDPVIAGDGFTYERSAIENWLNCGRHTSPMTNASMNTEGLRPNIDLERSIRAFHAAAGK